MKPTGKRTYRTAEFAELAGVTARALRHYDRLGLLRPRRSHAGYRIYSETDLETLEEIVALKFIGVPLKEIAAIRRHSKGPFADILRAQRQTLEARQRTLAKAIAAVAAAEMSLRSGAAVDTTVFRQIIEAMQMDTSHEETIAKYIATLKTQVTHMTALSAVDRANLWRRWSELVEEVKAAPDADPSGPKAQELLDRWISLVRALSGVDLAKRAELGSRRFTATPELRDELWTRRAEWLPAKVASGAAEATNADEALRLLKERVQSFVDSDVVQFIKRARLARDGRTLE
jgi:DNA-binding transcriptional MerR regulator